MTGLTYLDLRGNVFSFNSSDAWSDIDCWVRGDSSLVTSGDVANAIIAFGGASFVNRATALAGTNPVPTPSSELDDAIVVLTINGNSLTYNS